MTRVIDTWTNESEHLKDIEIKKVLNYYAKHPIAETKRNIDIKRSL